MSLPYEDDGMFLRLVDLGIALSVEKDLDKLLERILDEAISITRADAGSFYRVAEDEKSLEFAIIRNKSLDLHMGGKSDKPITFPNIPLYKPSGKPNLNNVVSATFHAKRHSNIPDVKTNTQYDFNGTKTFDEKTGYNSVSFLTVPLINNNNEVIAILQLINALDWLGEPVTFPKNIVPIIRSLAAQAAVILENQILMHDQKELWDSLLMMLASSIDHKSPYTGGHCQRVPEITKMLAKAACDSNEGIFESFDLTDDEWYELHVACWLHDCGKILTPEYVVDKSVKLETIYNRIHEVRTRFEILLRDAEIEYLKKCLDGADKQAAEAEYEATKERLHQEWAFVANANVGGEFMDDQDIARLREIGAQQWYRSFDRHMGLPHIELKKAEEMGLDSGPAYEPLLGDLPEHKLGIYDIGELYNLAVSRVVYITEYSGM